MDVLFASIAFPPKSDPEALQAARYFKYLARRAGVAVDVVTSRDPTLWMPRDPALEPYARGARQRVELPIVEPRLAAVALAKLAPGLAMLPDTRQTFHWQWRRAARRLRARPDVVYSRSFPLSSALMGLKLARHYGAPWVMHLSDPWTESALLRYRGVARAYNARAQRACFARAAAVTLASPRLVDLYRARWPRHAAKFRLAPNVFDPDDVAPPGPPPRGDRLRLVYTGSLQGTRSVRPLLDALAWCAARAPAALDALAVELAGSLDSGERARLAGAPACVRHLGPLPLDAAQRLQRAADALLAIDSPLKPEDAVFFPSKLLDYLAARRPVVAITGPGSMTRDVVTPAVGRCFDHADAAGLGAHLLDLVARHRARPAGEPGEDGPAPPEAFDARAAAARLHELFTEVACAR